MRIIIVEPHPDDALLSVGWHLETIWADWEKVIVTVYADDRRGKEAANYADAVGAESVVLGLPEDQMLNRDAKVRAVPELRDVLDSLGPSDAILFPLGLQHPDHLRVAATRTPGAWRYLDTPYQTKQKLAETLRKKTEGSRIVSLLYPGAKKWRHVPIFKSQAKFFHFNPMTNLRIPETVLCLP